MSAAKHTPGPWTRSHLTIKDSRGMIVAEAAAPHHLLKGEERNEDMEWCKGNARLIAAVPELLEALKEIEWSNDSKWQADRARAAISKATGAV